MENEENKKETTANTKGNNKIMIGVAAAVLVLAAGGFIFVKSLSKSNLPVTSEVTTTPVAISGNITTAGSEKAFTVEGGDYFFKPNVLKVKKGDSVKITFNNSNGMHDFVIDELGVRSKTIRDGESTIVTFTADKVGSFEFYCSVGQHRKLGMKGTLTVE